MNFDRKITAPVAWESEKALGFDVVLAEESTDRVKKIRVFLPKSQMQDGHATAWIIEKKIEQHVREWGGSSSSRGACFTIEGLTEQPIIY